MSTTALKIPTGGDDREREAREVKNHILFEIATEVAHRGKLKNRPTRPVVCQDFSF